MDQKIAQNMLNRMKEILADEFPEYTAKFGKTVYDGRGEINFKFSMVDNSAIKDIELRDNLVGLAKNKIHPEVIGMEFEHGHNTYVVESIRPRKQKYPVVARRSDGKVFRFPAVMINDMAFGKFGTKVRYIGNTAILD